MKFFLKTAACKVCTNECLASYDCGKEKTHMGRPLPLVGTNETCPLAKFDVEHQSRKSDKTGFILRDDPTLEELTALCEHCDFRNNSKDTGNEISLESCFFSHCIDCPVQSCRDGILECAAEAAMS